MIVKCFNQKTILLFSINKFAKHQDKKWALRVPIVVHFILLVICVLFNKKIFGCQTVGFLGAINFCQI